MLIGFTLCSNNYLAYARILAESFARYNPDHKFIIGLVDSKNDAVDYSEYSAFEILELADIGLPDLDGMVDRYNIVELNTAVKPFYFNYLFNRSTEKDLRIIYLDPDIEVFSSIAPLHQSLNDCDILLTPHVLTPIPIDGHYPNEQLFLTYGIYNLGFLALKRSDTASKLLTWWGQRLETLCYADLANGLYVDQLWMNLAPLFFENCRILKHPGANVAFWNLHERTIEQRDGRWFVNEQPLLFFHFSSVSRNDEKSISRFSTRFDLNNYSALKPLFSAYMEQLRNNNHDVLKHVSCTFVERREVMLLLKQKEFYKKNPHRWLIKKMKAIIPKFVKDFLK